MAGAGALDRRITLLAPFEDRDAAGGVTRSFDPFGEVWASRSDIRDGERFAAGGVTAGRMTRFVVRFSTVTERITERDRIRLGDTDHEILGIKETAHGRRRYLEITTAAVEPGA